MRVAGIILLCLVGPACAGGAIKLPSGQEVTLLEVIANSPGSDGVAMRYRFLAPDVARAGGKLDPDTAGKDMEWLCQTYALPKLPTTGPKPTEIIISMADRDVPFGESDPDATQFFNAYSIDYSNGTTNCLWEPF